MSLRPAKLDPLFQTVNCLSGVGPKLVKIYAKLFQHRIGDGDPRILDLLFHMPTSVIDRRHQPGIAHAVAGQIVTLKVIVDEHRAPPRGKSRIPYKIAVHDETGDLSLIFFQSYGDYLLKTLPVGETRYISGRIEEFGGFLQMPHPDHIVSEIDFKKLPLVEPVYPMTAGLSQKVFAKALKQALTLLPVFDEWIDPHLMAREKWPSFKTALETSHQPADQTYIEPNSPSIERLAYDEILASQLALGLIRKKVRKTRGLEKRPTGEVIETIKRSLPFEMTRSQSAAFDDISADLNSPERMLRLLQGDVGSGKTVVGLMAAAQAAEAGYQTAIMAPTEILARQHLKTFQEFGTHAGLKVDILTGREKGEQRKDILQRAKLGELDVLVGTHALFQPTVEFANLGLVIIDEQHRFGVQQRLALTNKGKATDLLAMTATPIPRTLVLTYFGDMDVSKITEKPAGRIETVTTTASLDRLSEITDRVVSAADRGDKIYWVCPLVEENEELEFTAAEDRFAALQSRVGIKAALIHGRMNPQEKEAAMDHFKNGDANILVATTVIEVGVDVPEASIIVIEHAERFGLSQLHQLRGRVGRGDKASTCLLLYKAPLGEIARARLQVMKDTTDGFVIAEEDLKLRGEGDVLGTKQSGMPGFSFADMAYHAHFIEVARDDARLLLEKDPDLESARGGALRDLLYLFDRDEAVRLLKAG